jgi:putative transposase
MGQPLRRRNSVRLEGYDYAWEGACFVTICAHERQYLFGEIRDGQMYLNACGEVLLHEWQMTIEKRPYVKSEIFVVMPNHFHAIVIIDYRGVNPPTQDYVKSESVGARRASPNLSGVASQSLGAVIGAFKSAVTRQLRLAHNLTQVWQRSYHEHIIRNEEGYNQIRSYIVNNPVNWMHDSLF